MGCPPQGVLGESITFSINTKDGSRTPTTPTGDVNFAVYENTSTDEIATGTMSKDFDDKTGFCVAKIAITAANGFERYKTYTIRITCTVAGVALAKSYSFLCVGIKDVVDGEAAVAAGVVTLSEKFTIDGSLTDVTSVKLSDPTGSFGVKRNDNNVVVVADGTDMIKMETGIYQYEFDEPDVNLTYTYWVEWVYDGETYHNEHTVKGKTTTLVPSRVMTKYVDWIKQEFEPLTLATPDATIEQCVENAIRYWNTHSGHKIVAMYDYVVGQARVQVGEVFKTIVEVYPNNRGATWIMRDHPLWSLLGIQILDNITTDLIIMTEAFRAYRQYIGTDMNWHWEKSDDPTVGGYLYVVNLPSNCNAVYVVGTKRITANEDITNEHILEWILKYSKALVNRIEGNTLRKSSIIDVKNDGQELVNEGIEEKKALQEKLSQDSRWLAFAQRG